MTKKGVTAAGIAAAAAVAVPAVNGIYGIIPPWAAGALALAGAGICAAALILGKNKKSEDFRPELCSDIKGIMLETNGRNYIISEDYYYSLDDNGFEGVQSYIENGVWHISDRSEPVSAPIEITVPAKDGPMFFMAELKRGNIFVNSLTVKRASFNVHTGRAEIHALKADDIHAEAGNGSVSLEASAGKSVSAVCGSGSINMKLAEPSEDFTASVSTGKGRIRIGDEVFDERRRNGIIGAGEKHINITCGFGDVNIDFGRSAENEQG